MNNLVDIPPEIAAMKADLKLYPISLALPLAVCPICRRDNLPAGRSVCLDCVPCDVPDMRGSGLTAATCARVVELIGGRERRRTG